jgi:hypothetical protein
MRNGIVAITAAVMITLAACSSQVKGWPGDPTMPGQPSGVQTFGESAPPTPGDRGTAKFGQPYVYDNGLAITITRAQRKAQGAVFTIKVTNNTPERFDSGPVSVIASYGKDGTQAEPGYDMNSDDTFEGTILPKHSRAATFSFKIPRDGMSDVVLEISPAWDNDELEPAIFEGAVK